MVRSYLDPHPNRLVGGGDAFFEDSREHVRIGFFLLRKIAQDATICLVYIAFLFAIIHWIQSVQQHRDMRNTGLKDLEPGACRLTRSGMPQRPLVT